MPSDDKKNKKDLSLSDLAAAIFATPGTEAESGGARAKAIRKIVGDRRKKKK
jgi:hypothetical protein